MKPNTIRLVTWNIRWGRGIDDIVNLDRTVEQVRQFTPFDILCLQEVASGYADPELKHADGRNQFKILASKLNGYTAICGYAVDQLGPGDKRQQFGNMIFSRFPVLQVYRHRLPWPAESGVKSMQRMALETLLKTPLGNLSVITTHLEFYSAYQRMAQVEYLCRIYNEAWSHYPLTDGNVSKDPFSAYPQIAGTILAGDFNFSENAPERATLLSSHHAPAPAIVDAWEMANPGKKHIPTMGYFDRERWPDGPFVSDYIFVSNNLASHIQDVRVETQSQASDHQALLLELTI